MHDMNNYLELTPFQKKPINVQLYPETSLRNASPLNFEQFQTVFDDLTYSFSLDSIKNEKGIKTLTVSINDDVIPCYQQEKRWFFVDQSGQKIKPFLNLIGFVVISLQITYEDDETVVYYSEPLSVLIHKDQTSNAVDEVEKIIDYVYQNQNTLLISNHQNSKVLGDLQPNRDINLEAKLKLAEEILIIYKDYYGYFKTNSRFKVITKNVEDDASKLTHITSATLKYIATHPEHLQNVKGNNGIRVNHKNYVPKRTLVDHKQNTFNIYENQVVLGFLRTIIRDLRSMKELVNKLLKRSDTLINGEIEGYIHSSFYILRSSQSVLELNLKRIAELQNEFISLLSYYQRIFDVDILDFDVIPKPSAILLNVPQYNNIYIHICKWYDYGIYNLEKERFLLSFMDLTSIYEVYVLAKIINIVSRKGFYLEESKRHTYKTTQNNLYENTFCKNTFIFKKDDVLITIYYQPVVFDGRRSGENGINLFRNNSYNVRNKSNYFTPNDCYYYTPDLIIKKEDSEGVNYYILDAKYSNSASVKNNHIVPLAFKYLISLSPRKNEIIKGLYIVYGKPTENDKKESVYNLSDLNRKTITPDMQLIPMTENSLKNQHENYISEIIDVSSFQYE